MSWRFTFKPAIGIAVVAVVACVWWAVQSWVALDLPPPLAANIKTAALHQLRAGWQNPRDGAQPSALLDVPLVNRGPVMISLWHNGHRIARTVHHAESLGAAVTAAGRALMEQTTGLSAQQFAETRVQIDVVVARGPVTVGRHLLSSLGLNPGLDGLGVQLDNNRELFVGADELVYSRALLAHTPMGIPEFYIGLDFDSADATLAARADLGPGEYGSNKRTYFRFRAESFIESPDHKTAITLTRTLPAGPKVTRDSLRAGAESAGQYLGNHLTSDGRFVYTVDLAAGTASDPANLVDYSLPRHAGATYFMAQLYALTKDPQLRVNLDRAVGHMTRLVEDGQCRGQTDAGIPYACLVAAGRRMATIGSSALAIVALAEYQLATGDMRFSQVHQQLVNFVLWMQKDNGQFCHLYDVEKKQRNTQVHYPYFDGEAALGIIRSHKVFPSRTLVTATEQALDAIIADADHFAGQFFFGEEHWTCIAAEAAWPELQHDRYRDFCSRYASFLRIQLYRADEAVGQPDFAGAYGGTGFIVPQNTPAGSRSEAMVSAFLLGQHHKKPEEKIRQQVFMTLGYLLRQQITERNDFWVRAANAHGAIPTSTIDRNVRIDYLQHSGSALLRAIKLVDAKEK